MCCIRISDTDNRNDIDIWMQSFQTQVYVTERWVIFLPQPQVYLDCRFNYYNIYGTRCNFHINKTPLSVFPLPSRVPRFTQTSQTLLILYSNLISLTLLILLVGSSFLPLVVWSRSFEIFSVPLIVMLDFGNRISQSFRDHMILVTKFDELTDIGSRLLKGFRQELEIFKKPGLDKTSKVVDGIVEANCTERMLAYVEAGFRHDHLGRQNITKLDSYQKGLLDHIKKVKEMINQLEGFADDAIGMVEAARESTSSFLDNRTWNVVEDPEFSFEKDETNVIENPKENSIFERNLDYAIMMRMIYNMLSLDFAMQEKIVLSLNWGSSSDELESYCLLWDLRPFVDDNIMQQCWRFV